MKLHVTDLDAMIWFNRLESMTAEDLQQRLLREAEPNEKMLMGTAFHAVLEDPPAEINTIEKNGFTFRIDCDSEITIPPVREIRANNHYMINGIDVCLTGGCDGIDGRKVIDHKLTFNPNPDTYFESFQWRAYLDIFSADVFEYYLYHATEKKGEVVIKDISTLKMYRYPDMVHDLRQGIADLVEFIRENMPNFGGA